MKFTPKVSTLKTVDDPNLAHKTLLYALIIQRFSGKIKDRIRFVRDIPPEDEETYKKTRERLIPAVITSGVLKFRNSESPDPHSLIVCIDLDDLDDAVDHFKHQLAKLPYVYAIIVSLSGNGLKVFIKIDKPTDKFTHPSVYDYIAKHISKEKIIIESVCTGAKALVQPCFFSLDEQPYFNPDCETFPIPNNLPLEKHSNQVDTDSVIDFQGNSNVPKIITDRIISVWKLKLWRNHRKVNWLLKGYWKQVGYKSSSERDLALCTEILFYLHDVDSKIPSQVCLGYPQFSVVELVDAVFRRSKCYRQKWDDIHSGDGLTYGQMTLAKALAHSPKGKGYNPKHNQEGKSTLFEILLEHFKTSKILTSAELRSLTGKSPQQINNTVTQMVKQKYLTNTSHGKHRLNSFYH